MMEIIASGIEKSLDSLMAELLLKTFKLVYKIDENSIISHPALFEDTLEKIIGKHAADTVIESIRSEFRRNMMMQ